MAAVASNPDVALVGDCGQVAVPGSQLTQDRNTQPLIQGRYNPPGRVQDG